MILRKKRIKKARYNGAEFYLETNETQGGKRIATHEFPYQDTPATEDLGKKPRQWIIQGFLFGALYKEKTKALQDALEQSGVGRLDHPYLGRNLKVRCQNYRISENNREFGFVQLSMTFTEAGSSPDLTTELKSLPKESFLNSVLQAPIPFVMDGLRDGLNEMGELSQSIQEYCEKLEDHLAPFMAVREQLGDLTQALGTLKEVALEIAHEPSSFLHAFSASVEFLFRTPLPPWVVLDGVSQSLGSISEMSLSESSLSFPDEDDQNLESTPHSYLMPEDILLERLFAILLIHLGDKVCDEKAWGLSQTPKQVKKTQKSFLSQCDLYLKAVRDASLFETICELKSQVFTRISDTKHLSHAERIRSNSNTNSILLSYELFMDLSQEEKILKLNPEMNPYLIQKGEEVYLP